MHWPSAHGHFSRHSSQASALVIGLVVALLAIYPSPLLPLADAYQDLCEQYPILTLLTAHAPPAAIALLASLVSVGAGVGIWAGLEALLRTHRFNQQLRRSAAMAPPPLRQVATELGVGDRVTYLAWSQPAAYCYGLVHPRIAITTGLLAQLDEVELIAVIAHERQHLHRRDPLRYLLLHTLSAAAFMVPVSAAIRLRQEARIELAADRAALTVAPPGALAAALLAVLAAPRQPAPGVAGLTATEARIAQLGGRALLPDIPVRLVCTSLGLAIVVALAAVHLATSTSLVAMVCQYCVGTT